MGEQVDEAYVTGALGLQGVRVGPEAARQIAAALAAQLASAAAAYAALPFEAEPPAFLVVRAAEKR